MRLLWLLLAGGWSSSWGFRAGPAVARPPARLSLALQAQSPSPPEGSDRDDATKARDGGSFLTALSDLAREAELKTSEWAEESERDRMARQLERTETRAAEAADRDQAGVDATEVRSAYNMEMLPPVRTEFELEGSEWRVAVVWRPRSALAKLFGPREEETWLRLARDTNKDELVAVWGNNRIGDWGFREETGTLTASQEAPLLDFAGSCTFQPDFLSRYYMMGWVRGWTLLESVSIWGLFEAVRIDAKGKEGIEEYEAPWEQMRNMTEAEIRTLVQEQLKDLDDQTDWFLPPEEQNAS